MNYKDGLTMSREEILSSIQSMSQKYPLQIIYKHSRQDITYKRNLLSYEDRGQEHKFGIVCSGKCRQNGVNYPRPHKMTLSRMEQRLIFYKFYGLFHVSTSCRLDTISQSHLIFENFRDLRDDEKCSLLPKNINKAHKAF